MFSKPDVLTRLVFFRPQGESRLTFGTVSDEEVVDRSAQGSWIDALASGGETVDRKAVATQRHALDDIAFLPPFFGEKIICVGVNYADRNAEYRDGSAVPDYPSLFVRFPDSFVGHRAAMLRPRESVQFDYEGEIALVIGTGGRHIAPHKALEHVAGLTLANDGTVRDWVRHGKFNVTQGKNFDASGSLGPWIVPATQVDLSRPLCLVTRVNGEVRQYDTTANLTFDFARLIAYISTFTTLKPGDLILTGTPTGAGARFEPPRWLKPGDTIEVEVAEIGTLLNTVADA
jgi:5-carboxymethyl-2-hydroxymuconate isomerase